MRDGVVIGRFTLFGTLLEEKWHPQSWSVVTDDKSC